EAFRMYQGSIPDTIMLRLDPDGFVEPGRIHAQPDVSVVLCSWAALPHFVSGCGKTSGSRT
ncbi:MAG: hypothetical protein ACI9BV_003821, partial [Rhodothermales bacterium]